MAQPGGATACWASAAQGWPLALPVQVVEMAPAPGLAAEVKEKLYEAAVKLARHIGYR